MRLVNLFEHKLNPNDHQKAVLAVSFYADTPELAYDMIVGDSKLVHAAKLLQQFGYLELDDANKRIAPTKEGEELAKEYAIVDDTLRLTENGKRVLSQFGPKR